MIPSPKRCTFAGLFFGLLLSILPAFAVIKPIGTFSSSGSNGIYADPNLRGVLIRVTWSSLETSNGTFNWTNLDNQIAAVKTHPGLGYSLAVLGGGVGSPAWLTDPTSQGGLGAPYLAYTFQSQNFKLPLFWNSIVQTQLQQLAAALAAKYNGDPDLKLVYITQMTTNGIEGHLQGINMTDFIAAGYTDNLWITAAEQTARSFANAFTDKALAFEVHEVNGTHTVPNQIITDLWNDTLFGQPVSPSLGHRVGAAMWWISGGTTYQSNLLTDLMNYAGDIYGQVVAPSTDGTQFPNGYAAVFTQAEALGMRYIEPWSDEFVSGSQDANLASFNAWADATFGSGSSAPAAPTGLTAAAGDGQVALNWTDNTESDLAGYLVYRATSLNGTYTALNPSLLTTSSFVDLTVTNGTAYWYKVTAVDSSANESGYSNVVSATPQAPITVSFYPTDDAFVYQGTPNGTNGGTTTVQLASTTNDRQGYLKFSVSGISGTVTSATLKLRCSITQTGSTRVYPVSNTTWTEGTLTWNNKPAMGAQTDSKTNVAAGQQISLNVTSLVTGNGTESFGLQTTSASTVQYYSKERTGTADDPVLQVTYQP